MDGNGNTLVEKSGFLPSTGLNIYESGVPTQYEENSSLIEGAKKEMEKIKAGSYTPTISVMDSDDPEDASGIKDIDTSFLGLRSSLDGGDDPRKRKMESYAKLNSMMKSIQDKSRSTYSGKQESYGGIIAGNQNVFESGFGIFGKGRTIKIDEAYDFLSDGNIGLAKYSSYMPGRDNEDYYAKRQSTWNKAVNGVGKLVTKTALYGVSGVVGIIPAAYNLIKTGTLSAAFDNDFTRAINDIDERINHALPHYYSKEEREMGFLQSMGTANFLFNDVLGEGIPFTTGAILSAYLTGGLGVSSLGAVGAKIGMRIAGKMAASKIAAGAVKSAFGAYRAGAMYGRAIGNTAKIGINTLVGAGWESSIEAQSFMKDSERGYKDYFKRMYNRNPTQAEMNEFRSQISGTANSIFLANMGIVGLSNYLLLGKYLGVDTGFASKYVPGLKGVSDAYKGTGRFVDRYLFGIGTKKVAGDAGKLQAVKANWFQKSLATVWNVSKRPISEGVWEEGMQGVAQRMGEDFIRSRYDKTYLDATSSVVDSFSKAVVGQFTSKDGLKEVGIGALIGGLFGAKSGFGVLERKNRAGALDKAVEEYNKNGAFTSQSVKDSMRNLAEFNAQMNDPESGMYSKFELSDRMGLLDDMAKNFRSMVRSLDESELASEMKIDEDSVKKYKEEIIKDFDKNLSNYQKASSFAEAVTAETSSDLYRANVANAVFRGLDAKDIAISTSKSIADYVNDNDLESAINTFYSLSDQANDKAIELRGLKTKIDELNSDIKRLATTPSRVKDGVDTEAEAIKEKTIEYDNLNKEYRSLSEELLKSSKEAFYSSDPAMAARELFDSETMTVEDVLRAYDSVSSLNTYIENNKGKKEAEDLRKMVVEYQQAITRYKAMRSFMNSIQDKKFMRHDFSLFSKFLNDMVSTTTTPVESDRFYQNQEGTSVNLDEKVDELLNSGQIDADEAFTMKVFGHLSDQITPKEKEDLVSDEDYEAAMEDPFAVPAVREDIVDKLYTGNADLLSPRESEIYNKYKQDFDDYVQSLGDSPSKLIAGAMDRLNKVLNPESVYAQNQNLVDMAKSGLEQSEKDELDKAIEGYKDLMNKREKGEDVDEDQLLQHILTIQDLGQVGNITDLLPYVEQNRLIENGVVPTETLSDFGTKDHEVETLLNETDESDTTDGANVDSVQNPEVLTVRRVRNDAGYEWYEISGLRADKFVQGIKSITQMRISSETAPNGARRWYISFGTDVATIAESPYHGRWMVDRASAAVLNRYTDVSIQDVGTAYSVVGRRLGTGAVIPYRTGVGFGVNESDKIDQDALSKVRKGDKVQLVVDVNDSYNQDLISQYNQAAQSGDKAATDRAEKNMTDNMVIKVMKDGAFISVVKSDTGGVQNLSGIRKEAFNKWKKRPSSSVIEVGTRTVAQTLPGRPVLNIQTTESGVGRVQNLPISEKGAKNIRDIGYVLDGKVVLRNGSKFTPFPFTTSIIRDKTGKYSNTRVPVVVIEGRNGLGYLYPVGLRQVESEEGRSWIQTIDMLLDPNNAEQVSDLIDQDFIQSLNAYLTKLGLDPATYQVSMLTPMPGLIKARRAIEERATKPDVERWVSDKSLDMNQILTTEVESGIDFEGEMFVAPKIRIAFGTKPASRSVDSLIEDSDLPFGGAVSEPNIIESDVSDTESVPGPIGPVSTPAASASSPKRTTSKKFSSVLDRIESHIKEKSLPEYHNIYDFIARKIVGGDIRFLRDKRNPESLKARMGLDINGTVGDKVSSTDGMTLDQYISYLRSRPEQVVKDYVQNRSDEQIISELKNFLVSTKFLPSRALNYSLRVNGMNTVKEYGKKEEVDAMESAINNLQSSLLSASVEKSGDIASSLSESDPDTAIKTLEEAVPDVTEDEKQAFLEDIQNHLTQTEESEEQNRGTLKAIENKIKEIENGQNGTGGAVRTEKDGDQKSAEQVPGQARGSEQTPGDGNVPGSKAREREVSLGIASESGIQYHRVTVASFSYGGDQAYSSIDADISPIPDNVMKRNGIRLGTSVTDLTKAGYKRAGGNWVYKFYMNTGVYDMYNVETGEAFRAKLHPGVKIQSSSFVRSLSQSGRQIEGVAPTWVENWSAQVRALAEGTNNEDSNREINRPC